MKYLANIATFFTNVYTKHENKKFIVKLSELFILFERKSLVTRCFIFSALAHSFVLFPGAFIHSVENTPAPPTAIEISLGSNFGGSYLLRPLPEIDAKPAPTPEHEQLQTTIPNPASKAEIKVSNIVKAKANGETTPHEKAQQPSGGNGNQVAPEDYLELLQYTVEDLSFVPSGGENLRGVAVLRLEFNRQGFVTSYALKKPTGQPILDQAANNVAARLTREPFPAAPEGFDKGERILRYDFLITYPPKPRVTTRS